MKKNKWILIIGLIALVLLLNIQQKKEYKKQAITSPGKGIIMVRMDDNDVDWSAETTDAIFKAFNNAQIPLTSEVWIAEGAPQSAIDYISQWKNLPYIEITQGMYGDIITGPPGDGQPGSNTWSQSQWETYIQTELNEFARAGVTPKTFFCNRDATITNNGLNAMHAKGFNTFDCPLPVPTSQRRTINPFVIYSNDWEESFALDEGSGTLSSIRTAANSMIASKGYANFVFHVWSDIGAANSIIPHLVELKNEGYVFVKVDEYYNYLNAPCIPKTCQELGYTCGIHDNGCGGTLNCGICYSDFLSYRDLYLSGGIFNIFITNSNQWINS